MTVNHLQTDASFREAIKNNKAVIINFFATWCGPCKAISPVFAEHSDNEKYKDVFFAKIDVEELSDLSDELDVQAMPTFLLFKDGVKVGALLEPKPSALLELVEKGI